jgi:hypothetical protein
MEMIFEFLKSFAYGGLAGVVVGGFWFFKEFRKRKIQKKYEEEENKK